MVTVARPALTRQRLARAVARRTHLSNKVVTAALDAVIAVMAEQLASGGRVELTNFLTLDVQPHSRLASAQSFWHTPGQSEAGTVTFYVLRCRPGKRLRTALRALFTNQSQRP